jgi:uncharacterized RDD family membrane protein YckC
VIEVPADALPPPPLHPPDAPPLWDDSVFLEPPPPPPPPPRPVLHVASAPTRFGAFVLDLVILGAGLGLGWVVWALATVGSGRGPGKHVLHLRLVEVTTGAPARWYYSVTRELVLKLPLLAALFVAAKAVGGTGDAPVVAVAFVVLGLGVVSSVGSIAGGRTMFDLLVGTVVVDERLARPVPPPFHQEVLFEAPVLDELEVSGQAGAGSEPS